MQGQHRALICAAALMIGGPDPAIEAQQRGDRLTVPFSDPSRPGTLKVRLLHGGITVRAGDVKEVIIDSPGIAERERSVPPPGSSGLRRLTQPRGVTVEEEANMVSVSLRPTDHANLEIQVPRRTNLQLSVIGGGIVVEGVDGEIEASNVTGPVTLAGVSGAVVAHSVNGKVLVTLQQVLPEKPMAFTSLSGVVDVTLPSALKANLKLRSDQGDIYTDFELQTQAAPIPPVSTAVDAGRGTRPQTRIKVDTTMYGSVNGGGPEFEIRTFTGDIFVRKGG